MIRPVAPARHRTLRRLAHDRRGATLIEFAIVAPTLCMMLMVIFDLGWRQYVASALNGALMEAARMATTGQVPQETIDAHVRDRLAQFSREGTVDIRSDSYADFTGVGIPETITSDTAPMGTYNVGDCYQDFNGNGRWDADRGRTGMGGAEDVVRYTVSITYPRIFPVAGLMGWSNEQTITANTSLRNQPFAARGVATPPTRCN